MGHDVELFRKADLALKKRNFDYAIELLLQGLFINPRASQYRTKLHHVEAIAIEEKGGNPQGGFGVKLKALPHETRAKKLHMQKKYEEEIMELEKSLRHQPQSTSTLMALAKALELAELQESAIGVLHEVVKLDSSQVEAYRFLGKLTASHLDDPEKAIEYWEKLRQYKPEDKEAGKAIRDLSAASMVKKTEARKRKGGDSFRSMLKDEEESEDLQKKQMIIRNDADRVRAIKYKVEEIKKDPQNSRLLRELGVLYQDLKKWEMAEKAFRKALSVNPQDLFAQERIGMLAEARLKNEIEELETQLNGAENPEIQEQVNQKSQEFLKFRLGEYKRRMDAHPTDHALKLAYAKVLKEAGNYDDAIGMFQQSLKDPKNKLEAKKEIGGCFIQKGLYDMAKMQFEQAAKEIADKESSLWKEIKYNLGFACEKNGEYEEALSNYQAIMAVDISYGDISQRVSELRNRTASS